MDYMYVYSVHETSRVSGAHPILDKIPCGWFLGTSKRRVIYLRCYRMNPLSCWLNFSAPRYDHLLILRGTLPLLQRPCCLLYVRNKYHLSAWSKWRILQRVRYMLPGGVRLQVRRPIRFEGPCSASTMSAASSRMLDN